MNNILAEIGLSTIAFLILYVIKKAYDYLYFKELDQKYKIDDEDDDI